MKRPTGRALMLCADPAAPGHLRCVIASGVGRSGRVGRAIGILTSRRGFAPDGHADVVELVDTHV